jgi:hypothetical protein
MCTQKHIGQIHIRTAANKGFENVEKERNSDEIKNMLMCHIQFRIFHLLDSYVVIQRLK